LSGIVAVKKAVLDVLRADLDLQSLLGKDENGDTPVYHSLVQHKMHKPCITVEDVTGQGEVSGLNDSFDGSKRYEWQHGDLQVDCWSGGNAEERDKIAEAVERCFLNGSNQDSLRGNGVISIQEPRSVALDEPNSEPPLWRKALRYRVFYISESEEET